MMKKLLSLLSFNATMMSVIPFTIACKKNDPVDTSIKLEKIFDSEPVDIGINESIFSTTIEEQKFEMNKKLDDYFKNLQFIALSVLNKIANACFLNTSSIEVTLYRDSDREQPIKNNDDLRKDDIALTKSIFIGFSTKDQKGESKSNNFENLLHLQFVEYDKKCLFKMEKTPQQQPYCESKSHEL